MRRFFVVAVVPLLLGLSACSDAPDADRQGLEYEAAGSSLALSRDCVTSVRQRTDHDTNPALVITISKGECWQRFQAFMASHRGKQLSASFGGNRIPEPSRIVGRMGSPYVQPVRDSTVSDAIVDYYSRNG